MRHRQIEFLALDKIYWEKCLSLWHKTVQNYVSYRLQVFLVDETLLGIFCQNYDSFLTLRAQVLSRNVVSRIVDFTYKITYCLMSKMLPRNTTCNITDFLLPWNSMDFTYIYVSGELFINGCRVTWCLDTYTTFDSSLQICRVYEPGITKP